jgi:hypothetical protein
MPAVRSVTLKRRSVLAIEFSLLAHHQTTDSAMAR